MAYDHVVGADITNRPEWDINTQPYTHRSAFYEPLVLFSHVAGITENLKFLSGVVILPQRQTVLLAKQTANLDVLCRGWLTLGAGLGWNRVEYEAVGEGLEFRKRASRMEDQIRLLRRLWTEPVLTETAAPYQIQEAGINPLPVQRPIPILIGGNVDAALKRAARLGDGWVPSLPASYAEQKIQELKSETAAAGRNPDDVIVYNNALLGATVANLPVRTAEDAAAEAETWAKAGAAGICFSTMDMDFTKIDGHIAFLRQLSELLGLKRRP